MYKNKYIYVNKEDTQAHLWNNMKNKQLVLHSFQLKRLYHEKNASENVYLKNTKVTLIS